MAHLRVVGLYWNVEGAMFSYTFNIWYVSSFLGLIFLEVPDGEHSLYNYFYKRQLEIMCWMLNEIRERCNATFNFFYALDIVINHLFSKY